MTTLLIKNIEILVTMDDQRQELQHTNLFIKDGFIQAIGALTDMPAKADQEIDLSGHIVFPGLVNTHHHFYQTLTRVVPKAQNANLFNWLVTLYPIWARMTPDDIRISTQTALAELALSGCTTASDHLYLFPNGSRLDDEIHAAAEVGLRLHASRGSMSLGESAGGLPPNSVVDSEEHILADSQRLIETYHDPSPGSMVQIVLAPCSPFSVTGELMRQSALLAREYGVHLHTHLAETQDEEDFCLEKFGHRPVAYMQGWAGLAKTCGLLTACTLTMPRSSSMPIPVAEWRTVPARICAWPQALHQSCTCWAGASRWAWEWTVHPAMIALTCWVKLD